MHFPVTLVALVLVAPVLGAPTLVPITKRAGPVKTNSYIVTFKDATSKDAFMGAEPRFTQPGSSVTYDYSIIPAAAMILDNADELARMQRVDGVKSIEPDSIVSINYEGDVDDSKATDLQASLNPSRRSERRSDNGEGVDIYGIDTGIYIQHNCFGGRAFWGETFGG
ncbi:subtilisin-like serine protease, partial [Ceratobasidium sp. 395]